MTPKKRLGRVPFFSPTPSDKCALKGCNRTRIPPTSFCPDHQGMFRRDTCDNMPALPPYCETHKRGLRECSADDASCAVCGCGGLCDPKERCPMARRPQFQTH